MNTVRAGLTFILLSPSFSLWVLDSAKFAVISDPVFDFHTQDVEVQPGPGVCLTWEAAPSQGV